MLTQADLRAIREGYIAKYEELGRPSIPKLCDEFQCNDEASLKQVRRYASKENWEGHRQKRKHKISNALAKVEDEVVETQASDMLNKRSELLKESIDKVDELLPKMYAELEARIESGFLTDASLLAGIKLLIDSRERAVETIAKDFGVAQAKTPADSGGIGLGMITELGLMAKITDIIEGKMPTDALTGVDYSQVSAEDERNHRALEVMDAEFKEITDA